VTPIHEAPYTMRALPWPQAAFSGRTRLCYWFGYNDPAPPNKRLKLAARGLGRNCVCAPANSVLV